MRPGGIMAGVRPRTWRGWSVVAIVLVMAAGAGVQLLLAAARAVHLVDMVPGADAGIATSAALEAARASSLAWGLVLLGLGVATAVVLLIRARRGLGAATSSSGAP